MWQDLGTRPERLYSTTALLYNPVFSNIWPSSEYCIGHIAISIISGLIMLLSGRERGSLSCTEQQSEVGSSGGLHKNFWTDFTGTCNSASDNILCIPVSLGGSEHQTWMSGVSCQNKERQENRQTGKKKMIDWHRETEERPHVTLTDIFILSFCFLAATMIHFGIKNRWRMI